MTSLFDRTSMAARTATARTATPSGAPSPAPSAILSCLQSVGLGLPSPVATLVPLVMVAVLVIVTVPETDPTTLLNGIKLALFHANVPPAEQQLATLSPAPQHCLSLEQNVIGVVSPDFATASNTSALRSSFSSPV